MGMRNRTRHAAVIMIGLLGLGIGAASPARAAVGSTITLQQLDAAADPAPPAASKLFTNAEIYAFLAEAKRAEAIADPLQRCLAYPSPPGSHWSPELIAAYCRYRDAPIVSKDVLRSLIEHDKAPELDQRFNQLLNGTPTEQALLDRTYDELFDGSLETRQLIDAWTRQAPKSAFAWAASAESYKKAAHEARGMQTFENTPAGNIEDMERLLQLADADARKAIALNKRISPPYVTMIYIGALGAGNDYALAAARQGLSQTPDNYGIYNMLTWKFQPRWGGSLGAAATIAAEAQTHMKSNPLLGLLQAKAKVYQVNLNNCNCHTPEQLVQYRSVFDQVATTKVLAEAGMAAESSNQPGIAVVYLSEALRFQPELENERMHRAMLLNNFDESAWAVQEANALLKSKPNDVVRLRLRATSYESLNDYPHAEADARAILAQDPSDAHALLTLSSIYIDDTQQWDKAWEVVNDLIKYYRDEPQVWVLRARIQRGQPRAGLKDTVDYYAAHFGNDPAQQKTITWLRAELALQQGEARAAAKAKAPH